MSLAPVPPLPPRALRSPGRLKGPAGLLAKPGGACVRDGEDLPLAPLLPGGTHPHDNERAAEATPAAPRTAATESSGAAREPSGPPDTPVLPFDPFHPSHPPADSPSFHGDPLEDHLGGRRETSGSRAEPVAVAVGGVRLSVQREQLEHHAGVPVGEPPGPSIPLTFVVSASERFAKSGV